MHFFVPNTQPLVLTCITIQAERIFIRAILIFFLAYRSCSLDVYFEEVIALHSCLHVSMLFVVDILDVSCSNTN